MKVTLQLSHITVYGKRAVLWFQDDDNASVAFRVDRDEALKLEPGNHYMFQLCEVPK